MAVFSIPEFEVELESLDVAFCVEANQDFLRSPIQIFDGFVGELECVVRVAGVLDVVQRYFQHLFHLPFHLLHFSRDLGFEKSSLLSSPRLTTLVVSKRNSGFGEVRCLFCSSSSSLRLFLPFSPGTHDYRRAYLGEGERGIDY